MSYANWNPTAFYDADDIVIYNAEDYQALVANTNIVPFGNPLTWNAISPPGPGPSNQLAFVQATTDLSIVGGNTVDITPKLAYVNTTNPATNVLQVGNGSVGVPTVPTVSGLWVNPVSPALALLSVGADASPAPTPGYNFLLATWKSLAPPATFQLRGFFTSTGGITIGAEWAGFINLPLTIASDPLIIEGSDLPSGILRLTNRAGAETGIFSLGVGNTLSWNGKRVSPVESGKVDIPNPTTTVVVATTQILTPGVSILSLTYFDDGSANWVAPTTQLLSYQITGANQFTITASAPAGVLGGTLTVAWAILNA